MIELFFTTTIIIIFVATDTFKTKQDSINNLLTIALKTFIISIFIFMIIQVAQWPRICWLFFGFCIFLNIYHKNQNNTLQLTPTYKY